LIIEEKAEVRLMTKDLMVKLQAESINQDRNEDFATTHAKEPTDNAC
jgi:hypothetical protein